MRTNKNKLIKWDADFYNSLSDDTCNVCLTEKQRYLIGQIIDQLNWGTRWLGDTSTMDLSLISGDLEYRIAGMADCTDCGSVVDCIETNEATQLALTNFNDQYGTQNPDFLSPDGTESTTVINNRFPPEKRNENAKEAPADCDLDEIWSGIYFMVNRIDETGRDWLEQAVANADKWQRAANIVQNIPIVGSLAQSTLLSLADVAQDILNLYNSYSTEAAQQEIACDLFELVCDECRYPTFQEIADTYGAAGISGVQDLSALSLKLMVDLLIGSQLAASQAAYFTVNTFVLWVLYAGSTFLGLRGAKWLSIWLDNGEEFANDEWEVLCDGCANLVWCYEWDFTASDGGFVLHNAFGTTAGEWIDGVGWQYTDETLAGFQYRAVTIRTAIFASAASEITEWYWEGDYDFGHFEVGGANPDLTALQSMRNSNNGLLYWDSVTQAQVPSYSGTPVEHMSQGLHSQTGTYFQFQWYSSNDNQSPVTVSGNVVIRKVRLKGTGTMPAFTGGTEC